MLKDSAYPVIYRKIAAEDQILRTQTRVSEKEVCHMKRFNTTGICVPQRHYMVDPAGRVAQIRQMVERGEYFAISRARQYGKTTTLYALKHALSSDYVVLSLDFQRMGRDSFSTESDFVQTFARLIRDAAEFGTLSIPDSVSAELSRLGETNPARARMDELFRMFRRWIICSEKICQG